MGKTKRKILSRGKNYDDVPYLDIVDDSAAKHRKYPTSIKLKPYILPFPEHKGTKHIPFDCHSFRNRTGKGALLNRRNANRSLKKGMRQKLKKELYNEINEIL